MLEVFDRGPVHGFNDLDNRAVVALGKLVRKERGGDNHQPLTFKRGLVSHPLHQRTSPVSHSHEPIGAGVASHQASHKFLRRLRKDQRPADEIGGISAVQSSHQPRRPRGDRDLKGKLLASAHYGQADFSVFREFLNEVLKADAQIWSQLDHALVVNGGLADFSNHVPFFEWIGRLGALWLMHNDSLDRFVEFEKGAQSGVFQGLEFTEYRRFAVIVSVRDVFKKEVDFFRRDDVTDVVRPTEMAERQTDHFAIDHRWAAAVAGIDGRINLDSQPAGWKILGAEFDPGHDALGDREAGASAWVTIGHDHVFDFGQNVGARQRRAE